MPLRYIGHCYLPLLMVDAGVQLDSNEVSVKIEELMVCTWTECCRGHTDPMVLYDIRGPSPIGFDMTGHVRWLRPSAADPKCI